MNTPPRTGGRDGQPQVDDGADPAVARPAIPQIAKLIWSTGFLLAAGSHALDILSYGWLPYVFMPLGFNIYWTSLLFLDPLAALLIWFRTGPALLLGCLIIASDVLVNAWTAFVAGYTDLLPGLALQSAFAVFVFYLAIRQKRSLEPDPDMR